MRKRGKRIGAVCASFILFGLSLPSLAALQGNVNLGYTLGYDDNIGGGNASQEENISNEVYVNVDLTKPEGFFRYDLFGQVGFLAQSSNFLNDDIRLTGGFDGLWLIKPNRLTWSMSDQASIRRRNVRGIASSGNTEQANFFRTGPSLQFQPSGRIYVDLGAFYQHSWFEFGDTNEYVGANFSGLYRISDLSRFTLSYSEIYYMPETGLASDSVSRSALLRFDRRMQRGSWHIGSGISQVSLKDQIPGENEDAIPVYTAGYNYQLSRTVSWDISGSQEVVTIGEAGLLGQRDRERLASSIGTGATTIGGSTLTPFEINSLRNEVDDFRYGAGFNVYVSLQTRLLWQQGRWAASAQVFANRLDVPEFQINLSQPARALLFPSGILDAGQETVGVGFLVSLEPKIRWLVDVGVRIENREVDEIDILADTLDLNSTSDRRFRDTIFTTNVTFAATRYLSFAGYFASSLLVDRDNSGLDVRNNQILLSVEYSL